MIDSIRRLGGRFRFSDVSLLLRGGAREDESRIGATPLSTSERVFSVPWPKSPWHPLLATYRNFLLSAPLPGTLVCKLWVYGENTPRSATSTSDRCQVLCFIRAHFATKNTEHLEIWVFFSGNMFFHKVHSYAGISPLLLEPKWSHEQFFLSRVDFRIKISPVVLMSQASKTKPKMTLLESRKLSNGVGILHAMRRGSKKSPMVSPLLGLLFPPACLHTPTLLASKRERSWARRSGKLRWNSQKSSISKWNSPENPGKQGFEMEITGKSKKIRVNLRKSWKFLHLDMEVIRSPGGPAGIFLRCNKFSRSSCQSSICRLRRGILQTRWNSQGLSRKSSIFRCDSQENPENPKTSEAQTHFAAESLKSSILRWDSQENVEKTRTFQQFEVLFAGKSRKIAWVCKCCSFCSRLIQTHHYSNDKHLVVRPTRIYFFAIARATCYTRMKGHLCNHLGYNGNQIVTSVCMFL